MRDHLKIFTMNTLAKTIKIVNEILDNLQEDNIQTLEMKTETRYAGIRISLIEDIDKETLEKIILLVKDLPSVDETFINPKLVVVGLKF